MGQAYADSIPMLVISAVNALGNLGQGNGQLHELPNQSALMSQISAFSHTLMRVDDLPAILARAFAVFDGARAFAGLAPDLERHAARCIASARVLGLEPPVGARDIVALAWDGLARFADGAELYIRPMFYSEDGFVTP